MESVPLLVIIGGVAAGTAALAAFIWNRFSGVYRALAAAEEKIIFKLDHDRRNLMLRDNALETMINKQSDKLAKLDKDTALRLQRLENGKS